MSECGTYVMVYGRAGKSDEPLGHAYGDTNLTDSFWFLFVAALMRDQLIAHATSPRILCAVMAGGQGAGYDTFLTSQKSIYVHPWILSFFAVDRDQIRLIPMIGAQGPRTEPWTLGGCRGTQIDWFRPYSIQRSPQSALFCWA